MFLIMMNFSINKTQRGDIRVQKQYKLNKICIN